MITLTKTINKLPENPLLKTNKGEHRFEMNIKTITGDHQQTTPQAPYLYHFFPPPPKKTYVIDVGRGGVRGGVILYPLVSIRHAEQCRRTSPANFSRQLFENYFACQLLMLTFRKLLHLPASHANFSRVTSRAIFSCQLFENYFTCQLLTPTFREFLHLPTSHANSLRVISPANFSCQLFS